MGGFGIHNNNISSIPSFASPNPTVINRIPSILSPSTSGYVLVCEGCRKPSFFSDENQLRNVCENLSLRRLLDKYLNNKLNSNNNTITENIKNSHENKPPLCQVSRLFN